MKKIKIFLTLFLILCVNQTFAAVSELQLSNFARWFPGPSWKTCKSFGVGADNPCIGASKNACWAKSLKNPRWDDEYGILMMVATETTIGGAAFCPTMIIGANKNRGNAWTEYYSAGDNCVWLCSPGYFGERCEQSSGTPDMCDTTKLSQSDYDSVVAVGPNTRSNIEDNIPNYAANLYNGCGDRKGQEHDLILAISNWLASGRGARVRPYVIRAERAGWKDMISWIDVYPAASIPNNDTSVIGDMLLCKKGYKPNDAGTDCVPIVPEVCGETNWCTGWSQNNFDETKHVKVGVGSGNANCVQWRCKESGTALINANGTDCEVCGQSQQEGVNPQNGTCVRCEGSKVFSKTSTSTGYCADTWFVDKNRLVYGSGTQSAGIDSQCWTMVDIDKYKGCVLKGIK